MSTPTPRLTSVLAFHELADSGRLGKMQKAVMQALHTQGALTGMELDDFMQSPSAHKRLSELELMGVVRSAGERECRVTGHRVLCWELTGNAPVAPAPKPGNTPTKRELAKAVEELRGVFRAFRTYEPKHEISPELLKTLQWLAKRSQ